MDPSFFMLTPRPQTVSYQQLLLSRSSVMKILSKALKILFLSFAMADNLEEIDKWLNEQGFNSYGDRVDTMYMGGSPLFDESTGESTDRMEYLLAKFPNKPWDQAAPQM